MELVLPSIQYKDSYIAAVKEFQEDTDTTLRSQDMKKLVLPELNANFGAYVQKKLDESKGINLADGWLPHTEYWLTDNGEYIGTIDIRHSLNEYLEKYGGHIGYDVRPSQRGKGYGSEILKLALPKAKELGISRILITCNTTNVASRKIIEKNGGVYENTLNEPRSGDDKMRFWIENK
jgi:predicted acetyltransferase